MHRTQRYFPGQGNRTSIGLVQRLRLVDSKQSLVWGNLGSISFFALEVQLVFRIRFQNLRNKKGNKKGQALQFLDSQNPISQLSLLQILSTDVRWVAHEVLR